MVLVFLIKWEPHETSQNSSYQIPGVREKSSNFLYNVFLNSWEKSRGRYLDENYEGQFYNKIFSTQPFKRYHARKNISKMEFLIFYVGKMKIQLDNGLLKFDE